MQEGTRYQSSVISEVLFHISLQVGICLLNQVAIAGADERVRGCSRDNFVKVVKRRDWGFEVCLPKDVLYCMLYARHLVMQQKSYEERTKVMCNVE